MRIQQITQPTVEAVLLTELKDHLRIEHDAQDAHLGGLLLAARLAAEERLGLCFISREVDFFFDAWACPLELTLGPVQSVSQVSTYDDAEVETVLDATNYYARPGDYGEVITKSSATLPTIGRVADGIRVRATVGFGDSWNDTPQPIRQGVMQFAGHLFDNPGLVNIGNIVTRIPFTIDVLWSPYERVTV